MREVNPYPWFYSGEPSKDIKERWQWTYPIIFSPVDNKTLFFAGNTMWKTTDGGDHWTELTRNPGLPKGAIGINGVTAPANPAWRISSTRSPR